MSDDPTKPSEASRAKPTLVRAADIAANEEHGSHPWNPKSEVRGFRLGAATGLRRTGVNLFKIAPGKESFIYHSHQCEEEWIYILSGRGVAEIDGVEHTVGPGDFMGFPAPSVAHHLANPFDVELVYLAGGESREVEIADYPKLGKRMIRRGDSVDLFDLADRKPFGPIS